MKCNRGCNQFSFFNLLEGRRVQVSSNRYILKKMTMIQFSVKQPIIIYYGTEIGTTQQQSIWDSYVHGDIVARQPMQWDNFDEELFLFYQNLCHKRSRKPID